jgi:hypothetical protein
MNLNGKLMDRIGALPIASDIRREYRLVCIFCKPLRPDMETWGITMEISFVWKTYALNDLEPYRLTRLLYS